MHPASRTRLGSRVLKREPARGGAEKKRMQKSPPLANAGWGIETGNRYNAYLTTDSSGLFAQRSLRWRLEVSVRIRPAISKSRFPRDSEKRISDTRVLCVVVVTHRGINVLVAAETRARPVHREAKVLGVRRPARIDAR
jgi:hypothetical protein